EGSGGTGSSEGGSSSNGTQGDSQSGSSGSPSSESGDSGGSSISDSAQQAAVAAIRGVGRFLTEFFIFLVVTFFYIKDRRKIAQWVAGLIPPAKRDYAIEIMQQTWSTVGGYIRGQAIIAAIDGFFVGRGLFIAGIPLAAALGVLVFLGAFVPVVGSIVAGAAAVAIGLVTKGLAGGLIALAIVVAVQQLEGNLLAPIILGRTVEIHPITVLAAVTAGAVLLGVWGAIIGVPLAASLYRAGSYLRDEEAIDGVGTEPA
ncbi:MAG: AI-2E family transporter, partial [Nitriliruptorales bacterium]|nr:AI-2E family transporter [Nitriliruptorales bacterium]